MWIGFCAKITQNCYFFAISLVSFVMRFFFLFRKKKQKKTNAKRFKIAAKMCNRFDMCKWRSVANTNVHVQIQITWANNVKTQQQLQQCAVHLLYYYLSSCNSSLIFIVSPTQSAFCTIQEAIAGEHTRAHTRCIWLHKAAAAAGAASERQSVSENKWNKYPMAKKETIEMRKNNTK